MRTTREYHLTNSGTFKKKLLRWSSNFEEVVWLDSNDYPQKISDFEAVLAVQAFTLIKTDFSDAFDKLQEYQSITGDWLFGYLTYDLKNDVEDLKSQNFDGLHFPDLYFFQPAKLIQIKKDRAIFHYLRMVDDEMDEDFKKISSLDEDIEWVQPASKNKNREIQPRISREDYLAKVKEMLHHIHRGDIYEANFCQEFFAENIQLDPLRVFRRLNEISVSPFAAYLKLEGKYLFSASPERYLKKAGSSIYSQPIKGTAARSEDPEEDARIASELAGDEKERSENIMIVDLVRNDLSRIAQKGTVKVEELCEIYTFKQVHQMISTVSAQLEKAIPPVEVLRATFPMGSMTGAPKISAMKIIEELEETKRGLYSGAVGYFTPQGDFDFNVVIRSILYNSQEKYASFSVGGAITAKSIPEKEYEECMLKARAMREVLSIS